MYRAVNIAEGKGFTSRWNLVTAAKKFGPPPRAAQIKSGCERSSARISSPSPVTASIARRLYAAGPSFLPVKDTPPPRM